MAVLIAFIALLLVGVTLYFGARAFRMAPGAPIQRQSTAASQGLVTVVLDLEEGDPEHPAAQRLAADSAARVLGSMPDTETVEVLRRDGRLIGRSTRTSGNSTGVTLPAFLVGAGGEVETPKLDPDRGDIQASGAQIDPQRRAGGRSSKSLAAQFDLPEQVQHRVHRPAQAVDIVRAILNTGGLRVRVDGDLLMAGNEVLIVIERRIGDVVDADALNHAYLRFAASGASRGVVLTPGVVLPNDASRREMLVPNLLHAGPEGIQRMADAVALGANPLRFAAAPALA